MTRNSDKFQLFAFVVFTFSVASLWRSTEGANILGLFTNQSPSGNLVHLSIVEALAEQGHNVTVILTAEPKITHKNINSIVIPPTAAQLSRRNELLSNNARTKNAFETVKNSFAEIMFLMQMQFDAMKNQAFLDLYENPGNRFDVVIMGYYFNDYQLGVAAKFKCPIILSWTVAPMEILHAYVGNPRELAYVPTMNIGVRVGGSMTFFQRVQNLLTGLCLKVLKTVIDYRMNKYYQQLYPNENFPTYKEMQQNVSLLFVNHHFSEGPVSPNVPALVEIGGIQIKEKPGELPKDIKEFLDSSENGAILLSLGSNLQGEDLKPETVTAMFNTLSILKQNVIWKWENLSKTPGRSKNILYKKWLHQADILAHPNVKLFITHAGKGGLIEAEYFGVPMVALPFVSDQIGNAEKMVASGYGVSLNAQALTEYQLKNAINEVLTNSKYREHVQRFSQIYRDRPLSARQNVVYWTEYVIRYHGARHLQSPLVHMNLIESLNFDVMAFLCVICYVMYLLCAKFGGRKVFKICFKAVTLYFNWRLVTFWLKFIAKKIFLRFFKKWRNKRKAKKVD